MNKYKYLISNIGLLALSSFATKLLSFFLVPLYTNILSTAEYGIYDLFNTTISLLFPILTIDITEAVLRFSLDKDSNKDDILEIGLNYCFFSSIIIVIAIIINAAFNINAILIQYSLELVLMYATTSFGSVISYYARGIGEIKHLSISGVLSSGVSIACNLLFLLVLKIGLLGYFYATILGAAIQIIYLTICLKCKPYIFIRKVDNELRSEMVHYSAPMVANSVSWWVNNASDRYVVTWLSGVEANGIYSVSYKIPTILSAFQSIFSQAWAISAVTELDKSDKSGFYINIYNAYNFMLTLACSILIAIDKPLAKILFAKDFYNGWEYVPFLLIGAIFSGMSAFIGGFFTALKDSKSFARTSVITAIVNTIGNIALVFLSGPQGAAISTAFAYFLMWILRVKEVKKTINLRINMGRDLLAYIVITAQAVLLITTAKNILILPYQFMFPIVIYILYKNEFRMYVAKLQSAINRKRA